MDYRRVVCLAGFLVILLGSLSGCTKFYWTKPGSTAEQFTADSRECALESSASSTGVELNSQIYQACLRTRGYARASQRGTPVLGSYRGLDDEGDPIVITGTPAGAPRAATTVTTFEDELARLDDLKARGRITADEYAVMRRRLVESYDPTGRSGAARTAAATGAAGAASTDMLGRWRRGGSAVGALDLKEKAPGQLEWTYETDTSDAIAASPPGAGTTAYRAAGTGTISGEDVILDGTVLVGDAAALNKPLSFRLKRSGPGLRGTATGPKDARVPVEFTR